MENLLGVFSLLWVILKVAIGIGFVIFVHELGHFLVAKACGVKVEKFLVGFDVPIKIGPLQFPRTLWKKQWGETLYAIGIIPLGGYVKMLGQDDNPSNYQAEAERTKLSPRREREDVIDGGMVAVGVQGEDRVEPLESVGHHQDEGTAAIDPRSYTAKSVPQRMAIISAGVIMNVIFAVIMGIAAYGLGVSEMPAIIAGTAPGSPAWIGGENWGELAHLQPGDRIVQIGRDGNPYEHLRFDKDLMLHIFLNGDQQDLDLLIQRDDARHWITVRPRVADPTVPKPRPTIGVELPRSLVLGASPTREHLAAGQADPGFQGQDKIVAIDGVAVADYAEFQRILARRADETLTFTVERQAARTDSDNAERMQRHDVRVAPSRLRTLGLHMNVGPLAAVQNGSPAEQAGMQAGDVLTSIDGEPIGDPMTLGQRLQTRVGEQVPVTVMRAGKAVELTVVPREPVQIAGPYAPNYPLGAEELGVAFPVLNEINAVEPGGPAEAAGLQPGDRIVSVQPVPAGDEQRKQEQAFLGEDYARPIPLDNDHRNWPYVQSLLQTLLPDTQLKVTYQREGETREATLASVSSDEFFYPERGLFLTLLTQTHTASSFGDAVWLGYRETVERFQEVVTVLGKLITGQLSVTNLAGPGRIAYVAGAEASQGVGNLLIFLVFLSVNLAVINALPIPVLDGGHFFFLMWEGIFGKPVSEKWIIRLTFAGLIFLLGLMVFVTTLDIGWFAGIVQ